MLFSQRAGIGGFKGPEMLQPFVISKMEDTTGFNQYLPFPCNHQSDQRGSTANGSSLPKISLPILVFAFIFFFVSFPHKKAPCLLGTVQNQISELVTASFFISFGFFFSIPNSSGWCCVFGP